MLGLVVLTNIQPARARRKRRDSGNARAVVWFFSIFSGAFGIIFVFRRRRYLRSLALSRNRRYLRLFSSRVLFPDLPRVKARRSRALSAFISFSSSYRAGPVNVQFAPMRSKVRDAEVAPCLSLSNF